MYNEERHKRLEAQKAKVWADISAGLPEGVRLKTRRADYPEAWERDLVDANGYNLGTVRINSGSGWHSKVAGLKLEADTLPNPRNQYTPSRNYKKVESLLAAIAIYCKPKCDKRLRLEELEAECDRITRERDRQDAELAVSNYDLGRWFRDHVADTHKGSAELGLLVERERRRLAMRDRYAVILDPIVGEIYKLRNELEPTTD